MTREELIVAFDMAKERKSGICVEIAMPGQDAFERIVNAYPSLDNKLDYYLKAYDENLVHVMNSDIRIVDAYPCDYEIPRI